MLDKNEGHSGIGGKVLQESCKRLQPSGRSAYGDDRERSRRQQIILSGVPDNGTALILRTRRGPVVPVRGIDRRRGRAVGVEGAP